MPCAPATKAGVPQFGLGQKSAGHKAGMPVFAACLANQQPGSWAGAFRLREGVVVIVIRDDLIVPDGDQFFSNENEARDRLLQEIGFGGVQRVYAPEAWAIPAADSMPISLLLDDRRDVRMRLVTIPKKFLAMPKAALRSQRLLFCLPTGWYIQEKNAEEEAARQAALERIREAANKKVPGMFDQQPEISAAGAKMGKKPFANDCGFMACRDALGLVPAALIYRFGIFFAAHAAMTVTRCSRPGHAIKRGYFRPSQRSGC